LSSDGKGGVNGTSVSIAGVRWAYGVDGRGSSVRRWSSEVMLGVVALRIFTCWVRHISQNAAVCRMKRMWLALAERHEVRLPATSDN
jgi:hypothetical protein